jgi:hypothetical protein
MTRGTHEKAAKQARLFCTHLGRPDNVFRDDDRVVLRILMRKMSAEEQKREDAYVAEQKRLEFLKWQGEMREEMEREERERLERQRRERERAERGLVGQDAEREEGGDNDAGAGAGGDAAIQEMEGALGGSDTEVDTDID